MPTTIQNQNNMAVPSEDLADLLVPVVRKGKTTVYMEAIVKFLLDREGNQECAAKPAQAGDLLSRQSRAS